ncbi:hypothetical protein MKK50_15070 [Methylobacterium sp. J-043]|nr:hypothetical protein [Methylobacterium sp. J-043]
MNRHRLETRTVATFRKALPQGRRAAVVITTARARSFRQMGEWGFSPDASYLAFHDCVDMAELENAAKAA